MRRASIVAFTMLALAVAGGLAVVASPYASGSPDGLEKVADDKGFLEAGRLASVQEESPIPDYALPGIADQRLATGLAGLVGTLGVFALALGIAYALRRRAASGEA
jgi:PDGLE domain